MLENSVEKIIDELVATNLVDMSKSFDIAKTCSELLGKAETEEMGRRIIINVLDNWTKIDTSTREMWTDLIESAGFYPYLEKEKVNLVFKNTAGEIRKGTYGSDYLHECYFHEEQRFLSDLLKKGRNVIASAPTSFGKSLLIQEVVASKKYKNIVIIQPTLALIDETRKKLQRYGDYYKVIVRTSQDFSREKGNIFLFTAERVMEYPQLPQIDFAVVDEFYKLSANRDEERSDVLNNAFNLLLSKHKSKFYLLGPNIDGISAGFAEKYNATFFPTTYTLVDNRVIDKCSEDFGERGKKKTAKEKALFDLLYSLRNEQTIIYCSSPHKVRYLSREFCNYLKDKNTDVASKELNLVDWIKENVNERWGLIECLNHGIGIHDGALQRHLTSSMIRYFNAPKLNYLFCTTTIIEGVNTSAKNVVFFDKYKGYRKAIDYFDYNNIKGRSGRMMIHYVGRIFNFNRPPEKERIIVDIPFFEQTEKISDEVLIQLDEEDVRNKQTEQYNDLQKIPKEERDLFRKNGVLVKGQAAILDCLKKEILEKRELLYWSGLPNYRQLEYVLTLGWKNLLKKTETTRPMTLKRLVKVTNDYKRSQDISQLAASTYRYFKANKKNQSEQALIDDSIREAFDILRHWFHYKVPKWLSVVNSLQKFVCEKCGLSAGDYSFFAKQIENDFVRDDLSILVEYGIPNSAIRKLERAVPLGLGESELLEKIGNKDFLEGSGLSEYEKEVIRENLFV
jgi:superfamily II DNA/RNA helicase